VLVASTPEILNTDQGDIWDSGKVDSDQSTNIVFAGKSLTSGAAYAWKVRVWDKNGAASQHSSAATFEMGLLQPDDWQGVWISWSGETSPLFRKTFTLAQPVAKARLYISGLGYYEARLNGEKIGDRVLDPGWTDYEKTVLYSTFDVTKYLQLGENALGVLLGTGRFAPPMNVVENNPMSLKSYGTQPCVLAQLNITLADGATLHISTDTNWKAADGPILLSDIYAGERYDARLEKPGWDAPGYNDAEWDIAQTIETPGGTLVSQAACPPIKVCHTLLPRKLTIPKPGVFVYDFGQNFTGWVKLRVSGPHGTEVKLRHAEVLYKDGTLNTAPNRKAEATEVYILKGEGEEVFEPRFTYHGFQYVELTGFPGTPSLTTIEGQVVHSDVPSHGNFLCSDPLINQIHQNILWGQLSNLMSIPTDCPQRDERMGWMGDAQLTAEEAVYNFDMAGFYTKWLRDIQDAQKENGSVPDVVPTYWSIYPADPAWGTACIVIPWTLYCYYADRQILEQYYPMMKVYVEYLNAMAKDDVLRFGKFGDWCPPWHVNSVETPQDLVAQWYYYHDTLTLSKIAAILGKTEDAGLLEKKATRIKDAFNTLFLKEDRYIGKPDEWYRRLASEAMTAEEKEEHTKRLARIFGVRSQTGPALALFLDMVPPEARDAVLNSLVEDIVVIHGTHLNTGIVGTRYILDVLTENGHADLAYQLVTQTTYPSWGYMIKEGATTLWERWEYLTDVGMNSQNHIMLGSVDAWFYRFLDGIQVALPEPSWQRINIKPYILGDLNFVSASVNTFKGIVSSRWTKHYDSLVFEVTIPVNTSATVSVPKRGWEQVIISEGETVIWQNGAPDQAVTGISVGQDLDNWVTFEVGSGSYCFEVREQ
jgi:alpha-L-rhamnosidase